jgi:hypothetical protein
VTLATDSDGYTAVLIQGSGTFSVEAVITTAVPDNGKLFVLTNGAYGQRMAQIAKRCRVLDKPRPIWVFGTNLADHPYYFARTPKPIEYSYVSKVQQQYGWFFSNCLGIVKPYPPVLQTYSLIEGFFASALTIPQSA